MRLRGVRKAAQIDRFAFGAAFADARSPVTPHGQHTTGERIDGAERRHAVILTTAGVAPATEEP